MLAHLKALFLRKRGTPPTSAPRRRRGYTVVEVMMALSVLSIGATGVVAMQKVTLLGNTRARDLATASAIASSWIERLHYDALRWQYNPTTQLTTLGSTTYLSQPQGVWFMPAAGIDAFAGTQTITDVKGMDTATALEGAFCVNIRLQTIMQNPDNQCLPGNTCPSTIRAEVRVFWLKIHNVRAGNVTGPAGAAFCGGIVANIEAESVGPPRYHFVHMTSAILRNDQ